MAKIGRFVDSFRTDPEGSEARAIVERQIGRILSEKNPEGYFRVEQVNLPVANPAGHIIDYIGQEVTGVVVGKQQITDLSGLRSLLGRSFFHLHNYGAGLHISVTRGEQNGKRYNLVPITKSSFEKGQKVDGQPQG